MSVNMDTLDDREDEVDYSDFTHEVWGISQQQNSNASSSGVVKHSIEPLAESGGLRPNQVAELVAVRVSVAGVVEEGDSGVDDAIEVRGVVGFDLDNQNDPTRGNSGGNPTGETEIIQDSGDFGTVNNYTVEEPGIVTPFRATGGNVESIEKHFRTAGMTGRGPVVDPNDEWTVIMTTVNLVGALDAQMYVHAYWDIYEVDDARSEFALPD